MHKNVISWARMIVIVKGVRTEKRKESDTNFRSGSKLPPIYGEILEV